jgi:histidyl-tRNA synthetase
MSKVRGKSIVLRQIPGFPELSENEEIVQQKIINQIKAVYEKYSFSPLETRLIEPETVLKQKGVDNKELYVLDKSYNDETIKANEKQQKLFLRFDQTVPMARYVAENKKTLLFPYKRYQIQRVYRAEDAKVKRGRFNEFYQCDIDIVGRNTIDIYYDSEFPAIIYNIFKSILNIEKFVIRINNRKILEGLFQEYGLDDTTKIKRAVKVIDDIEKVEQSLTITRLNEVGLSTEIATTILELFREINSQTPLDAIKLMKSKEFKSLILIQGLDELETVFNGILANGVPESYFKMDLRIARGLDYYTGTVYETTLSQFPELGSVCSGGRYDDLITTITGNKNDIFPGVGISIGLSRLIPTLIKNKILDASKYTVASICVTCQSPDRILDYQKIATLLRQNGFNVNIYIDRKGKLIKQLDYINNKGFKYAIIANGEEIDKKELIVRDMTTSQQDKVMMDDLVGYFRR